MAFERTMIPAPEQRFWPHLQSLRRPLPRRRGAERNRLRLTAVTRRSPSRPRPDCKGRSVIQAISRRHFIRQYRWSERRPSSNGLLCFSGIFAGRYRRTRYMRRHQKRGRRKCTRPVRSVLTTVRRPDCRFFCLFLRRFQTQPLCFEDSPLSLCLSFRTPL